MSSRHYLDHASTSPLRPEASAAIAAWLSDGPYADAGRPYVEGQIARDVIEHARSEIALLFHVREREVIFTCSGTESIAIANESVRSIVSARSPIAFARVEHSAVRLGAERLGHVVELAVDRAGRIDVDQVRDLLRSEYRPCLVHCQFANHEVATTQSVEAIVSICREAGVRVHVDACAATGQMPIDFGALGADFVSISAHKFGGPPGVGALIVRRGAWILPLFLGGEQERGRRAGFENTVGIVGFGAVASTLRVPHALEQHAGTMRKWTEQIERSVLAVNGIVPFGDTTHRLPHVVCFGIADVEAEGVVLGLDQRGIAVHSGSACSSESFEPSPVLEAMGVDADRSLRCSVGWSTTEEDIRAFEAAFAPTIDSLRVPRLNHAASAALLRRTSSKRTHTV